MSTDVVTTDFAALQDGIQKAVMSTVKAVNTLAGVDIDFQRSSDPEFASAADATRARLLEIANSLLRSAAAGADVDAPNLQEEDDVESKWADIVEVADFLLERADTCLDEYTGAIKHKNPEPLPGAKTPQQVPRNKQKSRDYWASINSWSNKSLSKPQLLFDVKPDNMDNSPFRPLLTAKPHAKVPLEKSFEMFTNDLGNKQYIHPYAEEIKSITYPESIFQAQEPRKYLPFDDTEAVFVDTPKALVEMLQELKGAKEIAIDLEHHDQRSYIGFVCLMQISTREKDWIVDTLKLRRELQVLNEVFTDPKIIKVLHGANMDIIWLQRDFGLYIVGLFDTYWAARTLGFPGHGLAFLLKKYVDFDADKQYQLADWRLRPLPEEMFNYARSDTHFLLYIFDCIRNELLDRSNLSDSENKMALVLKNSEEVSLRLYEREAYDAVGGDGFMGWRNILGRSQEGLNPMQVSVFKAVHQWRDTTARAEDESVNYIMPRHVLFNLARRMPMDVAGVLACCPRPSPPLRNRAAELVVVVKNAKDTPAVREWLAKADASKAADASQPEEASAAVLQDGPRVEVFLNTDSPLRAQHSSFWGTCGESSHWNSEEKQLQALRLAIPLPQLTAEVFVSEPSTVVVEKKEVDPGARAEHEYVKREARPKKEELSDVITIRSLGGRKRKHEASNSNEEVAAASSVSTPAVEEETSIAEDKPSKKRKKHKTEKGKDKEKEEKEAVPFDYETAPSVLNMNITQKKEKKEKKQKAFNPYAGAANAPKGLGRSNQERAGRTGHFKGK